MLVKKPFLALLNLEKLTLNPLLLLNLKPQLVKKVEPHLVCLVRLGVLALVAQKMFLRLVQFKQQIKGFLPLQQDQQTYLPLEAQRLVPVLSGRDPSRYGKPVTLDELFKKGGSVKSSASKRADGIAVKGKTRGRMV
jgi:hypothetical protein